MLVTPIKMNFRVRQDDHPRNDDTFRRPRTCSAEVESKETSRQRQSSDPVVVDAIMKKMERSLEYASRYAREGKEIMTQSWLNKARKHATVVNSLVIYNIRAIYIQKQLHDSQKKYHQKQKQLHDILKKYHQKEMTEKLSRALKYAEAGDKAHTDCFLQEARHHAVICNAIPVYDNRATDIHQQLLRNERKYHVRNMEKCLSAALHNFLNCHFAVRFRGLQRKTIKIKRRKLELTCKVRSN